MKYLIAFILFAAPSFASPPEVVDATASKSGSGWSFSVTLAHPDTGWDHYADGWGVYSPDGTELGYRTLHHPHVEEQPFTRSLGGVSIPEGTEFVLIRPRCNETGDGADFKLQLAK
ncbi:hypothetical protein GCM10007939_17180 [Amylibacter marinus]|uniref:Secreted protein n=1 Tax=Amylibacter marinus TaxID=1475483 RepID=A0ABQ5VVI7_9RHOB|nr:hypothetical protein [Amylibacter marinus]GLQ35435.1 hypothetical protein GCM10007939_17180 [Amylibacter marinus]